jgi:hypothetical protein
VPHFGVGGVIRHRQLFHEVAGRLQATGEPWATTEEDTLAGSGSDS